MASVLLLGTVTHPLLLQPLNEDLSGQSSRAASEVAAKETSTHATNELRAILYVACTRDSIHMALKVLVLRCVQL